ERQRDHEDEDTDGDQLLEALGRVVPALRECRPGLAQSAHPASRVSSPSRPCGLKTMIRIRYPNTMAGVQVVARRSSEICWMQPMIRPPSTAPLRFPMPPITAAVKASRPAWKP